MPKRPQRRTLIASANSAPEALPALPAPPRGVALGVAAVAELLAAPARDVTALAARLRASRRAVGAALRRPSIAPLVRQVDGVGLVAVAGATSATLPRRQRLALAPIAAPRERRRPRRAPARPARAARSLRSGVAAAAAELDAGALASVVRATERLWRRAHLTYDQTRVVAKRVRAQLELAPTPRRRGAPPRLGDAAIARLLRASYAAAGRRRRGGDASRARGLLVKTLLLTGARVSEFVRLRVEDLDVEAAQIRIARGKGGKAREVPILPELAHELRTHLAGRRSGWLFETWSAKPYSPRRVQYLVREVATAAGIEHRVWPHLLRHTIAQHLIDRGMPVDQVRRFLGHGDLKTTQVYAEASAAATGAGYRRALGGDGVSERWAAAGDLGAPSPALFRPPAKRVAGGACSKVGDGSTGDGRRVRNAGRAAVARVESTIGARVRRVESDTHGG